MPPLTRLVQHVVLGTSVVVALTFTCVTSWQSPASAEPAEKKLSAAAEVDPEGGDSKLRQRLEDAIVGFNTAHARLETSRQRAAELKEHLAGLQNAVQQSQDYVDDLAAAGYKGNDLGLLNSLVGAGSAASFVESMGTIDRLSRDKEDKLRSLRQTKQALSAQTQRIAHEVRTQSEQEKIMSQRRADAKKALEDHLKEEASSTASPDPTASTSQSTSASPTPSAGSASATASQKPAPATTSATAKPQTSPQTTPVVKPKPTAAPKTTVKPKPTTPTTKPKPATPTVVPAPRNPDGTWPKEACSADDPTSSGCLTPRTLNALKQTQKAGYTHYVHCYRQASFGEHPKGRACDFAAAVNGFGGVATGSAKDYGNRLTAWYLANASRLGVLYVIWFKRIWLYGMGWEAYTSGKGDPSSDHTNHVHLSVQ